MNDLLWCIPDGYFDDASSEGDLGNAAVEATLGESMAMQYTTTLRYVANAFWKELAQGHVKGAVQILARMDAQHAHLTAIFLASALSTRMNMDEIQRIAYTNLAERVALLPAQMDNAREAHIAETLAMAMKLMGAFKMYGSNWKERVREMEAIAAELCRRVQAESAIAAHQDCYDRLVEWLHGEADDVLAPLDFARSVAHGQHAIPTALMQTILTGILAQGHESTCVPADTYNEAVGALTSLGYDVPDSTRSFLVCGDTTYLENAFAHPERNPPVRYDANQPFRLSDTALFHECNATDDPDVFERQMGYLPPPIRAFIARAIRDIVYRGVTLDESIPKCLQAWVARRLLTGNTRQHRAISNPQIRNTLMRALAQIPSTELPLAVQQFIATDAPGTICQHHRREAPIQQAIGHLLVQNPWGNKSATHAAIRKQMLERLADTETSDAWNTISLYGLCRFLSLPDNRQHPNRREVVDVFQAICGGNPDKLPSHSKVPMTFWRKLHEFYASRCNTSGQHASGGGGGQFALRCALVEAFLPAIQKYMEQEQSAPAADSKTAALPSPAPSTSQDALQSADARTALLWLTEHGLTAEEARYYLSLLVGKQKVSKAGAFFKVSEKIMRGFVTGERPVDNTASGEADDFRGVIDAIWNLKESHVKRRPKSAERFLMSNAAYGQIRKMDVKMPRLHKIVKRLSEAALVDDVSPAERWHRARRLGMLLNQFDSLFGTWADDVFGAPETPAAFDDLDDIRTLTRPISREQIQSQFTQAESLQQMRHAITTLLAAWPGLRQEYQRRLWGWISMFCAKTGDIRDAFQYEEGEEGASAEFSAAIDAFILSLANDAARIGAGFPPDARKQTAVQYAAADFGQIASKSDGTAKNTMLILAAWAGYSVETEFSAPPYRSPFAKDVSDVLITQVAQMLAQPAGKNGPGQ